MDLPFSDDERLELPPYLVLYRNQQGADDKVVPQVDAMFRDIQAAHRHLNMYRPLAEHEFLTLEELDHESGTGTVHSALTARTMRMVITDNGPRAMPKEMAALWGQECDDPECGCHDDEEGDDDE
jgi:hypothetical protein